jgi:PEP-CTERM motif
MKLFRYLLRAAIFAFAVVSFTAPKPSYADTYQIYDLGSGTRRGVIGITDTGTVVISNIGATCDGSTGNVCFVTWVNGEPTGASETIPDLPYDDGTPCAVLPAGATSLSRCNNGHEVLGEGAFGRGGITITNPPPNAVLLVDTANIFVNSLGDYVTIVGIGDTGNDLDGEVIEGIDLTTRATPEPASIVLLGTGVLAALGSIRRRQQQK